MFSYTPSMLWKDEISIVAVFSPTPGTPGMLSELSPISALRSMISEGVTPYFSFTAASSMSVVSVRPIDVEG